LRFALAKRRQESDRHCPPQAHPQLICHLQERLASKNWLTPAPQGIVRAHESFVPHCYQRLKISREREHYRTTLRWLHIYFQERRKREKAAKNALLTSHRRSTGHAELACACPLRWCRRRREVFDQFWRAPGITFRITLLLVKRLVDEAQFDSFRIGHRRQHLYIYLRSRLARLGISAPSCSSQLR